MEGSLVLDMLFMQQEEVKKKVWEDEAKKYGQQSENI